MRTVRATAFLCFICDMDKDLYPIEINQSTTVTKYNIGLSILFLKE